ncbi:MAG: HAMP domain-containing protein [Cellvibrionaceae bacterium]
MSDKKIHFLVSVQAKIIFITLIIITIILGAYAAYDINRRQNLLDQELDELAKVTAKKLENNLRIPLWDLDSELVADTVEAEMLTREVSAILVFDSNGSDLIAGRQRGANWDVLDAGKSYRPSNEYEIRKETFINNKNERIGSVIVYANKKFKQEELNASILGLLITLILLDITIVMVLWVVMTNILRKPITQLSDVANQISRGDFSAAINTERQDEIGVVANSIERMKVSLNMAIERLRKIEHKKKEALRAAAGRKL